MDYSKRKEAEKSSLIQFVHLIENFSEIQAFGGPLGQMHITPLLTPKRDENENLCRRSDSQGVPQFLIMVTRQSTITLCSESTGDPWNSVELFWEKMLSEYRTL